MAVHIPDFVRVTIDGTGRTAYVVSYARHSTLCAFSDTFTLELSFEIPATPDPYDSIVINELYDGENEKVIGGYIIDVIQNFDNGNYIINGQDKTLLLDDYYIHEQPIANNETVAYWMNYYAGLVGLSVQYDSSVTQFIVEEGTPMGMITASDGMMLLERLAAVYIKYDATIDKLRVFRINTSEPVIQITNNATTKFDRERSTDKTRNVVKVYGAQRYNIFSGTTTQVTAKAVTNVDELVVDKTAVIANPHVRRVSTAQLIATRILQIVDDVDDVLNIETAGFYPQIDVGDYIGIDIGTSTLSYSADREVTSIQTTVDPNGVVTIFTVGEKCPRVSIMPPVAVVYSAATNAGILISWDAGDSFGPFNKGIVSQVSEIASGIDGTSIAANKYGQLMAIVDNSLYSRTGKYGRWTDISAYLSGPTDDEGEHQFSVTDLELVKIEKNSTAWGRFSMLARVTSSGGIIPSGQERWWAYWTPDFGASWDSMQLYVPASGVVIGAPSGIPAGLTNGIGITHEQMQTAAALSGTLVFNVDAKDIEGSQSGNYTILVEGEPGFWIPEDTVDAETFYAGYVPISETPGHQGHSSLVGLTWYMDGYDLDNYAEGNHWYGTTWHENENFFNMSNMITLDSAVFSIPNNREVAYMVTSNINFAYLNTGRTRGEYSILGEDELDIPIWEHLYLTNVSAGTWPGTPFYALYDWSSLNGSSTIARWTIAYKDEVTGHNNSSDSYPSNAGFAVQGFHFADDIAVDHETSTASNLEIRIVGIPVGAYSWAPFDYYGEGLFGYTAMPSTASPVPRYDYWAEYAGGGACAGAMTTSKTGTNYGFFAWGVKDAGQWHGDDRDPDWWTEFPEDSGEYPFRHPRDWDEKLSRGIYVIKYNLTTQTIESIEGKNLNFAQYFDNPPDDDTDVQDYAVNGGWNYSVKMINPNLIYVFNEWTGHGGAYNFWVRYPGFSIIQIDKNPTLGTPNGVLKVPYYTSTMHNEYHTGRTIGWEPDPVFYFYEGTTSYHTHTLAAGWDQVSIPPESPSGQVLVVHQHPGFGIGVNEMRAQASGRGSQYDEEITNWDYDFMWKAQRANPTEYTVLGSQNQYGVLDPYDEDNWEGIPKKRPPVGRINEGQGKFRPAAWAWRTILGSTSMAGGGSSGIWNFLD